MYLTRILYLHPYHVMLIRVYWVKLKDSDILEYSNELLLTNVDKGVRSGWIDICNLEYSNTLMKMMNFTSGTIKVVGSSWIDIQA